MTDGRSSADRRGRALRAIAFDFDGVLVESVDAKTLAFARLFAGEGPEVVARILTYHLQNGGISRFEKFRVIYREILGRPLSEDRFRHLCEAFAALVVDEIVAASWVDGAQEFLTRSRGRYAFFIVSGTPEAELKDIVRRRDMDGLFDEVLGAPRTKEVLLRDVMARYRLGPRELVFVGDSETDRAAARAMGVPFIWRRASETVPVLPGFSGPMIASLADLDQCLTALARPVDRG